ncbi:hypothetical protein [Nocardioides astragali]|uniref:Uncharacterized protein n=1 Tax=Nocardioides astragali TaxID=1776736 RepID=A0ABW2N2L7_9ACTN|nr:hypothetical protein [Nocardioides astragali]
MNTLSAIGTAIELVGLALAIRGLVHTWRQQAGDARFLPTLRSEFGEVVLGRTPDRSGRLAGTLQPKWFSASATAVPTWPADLTLEEKVEHLLELHEESLTRANDAQERADQAHKRLNVLRDQIDERISNVQTEVATGLRAVKLEGLPLTVFGLAIVTLGTILQLLDQLLPG